MRPSYRIRYRPPHFRGASTTTAPSGNEPTLPSWSPSRGRANHSLSFRRESLHESPVPTTTTKPQRHPRHRQAALEALAHRLSFFFSDVNLRHDVYARSILEQYDDKYLPMQVVLSFRSIQRYTQDETLVLMAVDWIQQRRGRRTQAEEGEEEAVSLETFRDDRGQLFIGRTIPFRYRESMRQSHDKIMIVEGWPVEENTQWIESRVRSFLCRREPWIQSQPARGKWQWSEQRQSQPLHRVQDGNDESPTIAYWSKNVPRGIITVEFNTVGEARRVWDYLHSHSGTKKEGSDDTVHPAEIVVRSLNGHGEHAVHGDERYGLHVGGLSLVVRGMNRNELDAIGIIHQDAIVETPTKLVSKHDSAETMDHSSRGVMAHDSIVMSHDAAAPAPMGSMEKSESEEKWWRDEAAAPSLSQCTQAINQLYNRHVTLPPPPREWLHEQRFNKRGGRNSHAKYQGTIMNEEQWKQRNEIAADVACVVSRIRNSIDRGVIRALGARDAYVMSDFLSRAMLVLSESPPANVNGDGSDNPAQSVPDEANVRSPYQACLEAFDILRSLNLDLHPHHYSYAIRCACHESRWEEAANIFMSQIHGDDGDSSRDADQDVTTGGFVPVDPTLGWDRPLEVGLYAVAVDAWFKIRKSYAIDQDDGRDDAKWVSPSQRVFDTAMNMSMIAPSGQESYVLAAGCALGRAGLWSDCLDFATDQSNLSKFGPSIAAASMLACIESARSAEAIDVYNFFVKSESQNTASEWQWAGGTISAAKPLFDDLLLRAMGGVSGGGYSCAAIQKFCHMVDNDIPVSGDALVGLSNSIEHDGDWRSSIQLLEAFCDSYFHKSENKWRLVNGMLRLNGVDTDEAAAPTKADLEALLSKLLASTMRVCNREGHFGLAMLVCSIANSCLDTKFNFEIFSDDDSTIKAILSQKLLGSKPILNAYLQSLHRVGLRRLVSTITKETEGSDTASNDIQNFSPAAESWIKAFTTTNRVLMALNDVQRTKTPLSDDDRALISRGISTAMNFCIDANQPASAIHLFEYANSKLAPKRATASFRETVMTFFGDRRSEPDTVTKIFQSRESFDYEALRLYDSLLSAVIRAYTMMGQPDEAFAVFDTVTSLENYGAPSQDTIQSFNAALEVLLENNPEKFMSIFEDTNSDYLMPSTFLAVARSYARNGAWPEIGEVYNKARRRGCVSEEIGFIAMQAVCEAELVDGKIVVLRKIADDISNTIGMKTEEWISSQYWYIKRYAGFHHARLLMNWNTPATSQKEELLFAINEMRRCRSQGVLTKNAPLFCIVKQGELYASSDGTKNISNLTESQRRSAINIIFEACSEAQLSGLIKRPTFTAEVVRSLRALNGDKQCIQFVKTLIVNEEKCPHKIALEYAIRAASESRDFESLEVLIASFEKSGYNSRSLSLLSNNE